MGGLSPLLGLELVLFREKVHRLTVYTLFEDTSSRINNVRAPIMVFHGNRDRTVPIDMGRELFDAANPPKRFYEVPGADHNDTYLIGGAAYFDALAAFLHDPTNSER